MSAKNQGLSRRWILLLVATSLAGATTQAAFLGADAFPISPLLSVLIVIFCTGKVGGAILMARGRKLGWWIWLVSALNVALTWFMAANREVAEVHERLEHSSDSRRTLGGTEADLGSSPVWGLATLLTLVALWAVLYWLQRRHFTR